MRWLFLSICILTVATVAVTDAAEIRDVKIPSAALKSESPLTVILPDSYAKATKAYPVVYILHGYTGNNHQWLDLAGDALKQAADRYEMIIVLPDGGRNSWYFDSPVKPEVKYETHISSEVIAYVDSHFRTIASPKARAITGGSMGGHGAMLIASRHKELFCAAGTLSGGLDFRPWPDGWDIKQVLGPKDQFPQRWDENAVINNLDRLKPGDLAVCVDVGAKDFFLEVNRAAHKKLLDMGIDHVYIERPGAHDAPYWPVATKHQLFFFNEVFREKSRTQ